jgi:hypothetical protein
MLKKYSDDASGFKKLNKGPETAKKFLDYVLRNPCPAGIDLFLKSTLWYIKLKIVWTA